MYSLTSSKVRNTGLFVGRALFFSGFSSTKWDISSLCFSTTVRKRITDCLPCVRWFDRCSSRGRFFPRLKYAKSLLTNFLSAGSLHCSWLYVVQAGTEGAPTSRVKMGSCARRVRQLLRLKKTFSSLPLTSTHLRHYHLISIKVLPSVTK